MNLALAIVAVATLVMGFGIGAQVTRTRGSAETAGTRAERDRLRGELDTTTGERDRLRGELHASTLELRSAAVSLAEAQTRLKSQEAFEAQLQESFGRMSNEALQTSRQQLLDLADDRFRRAGQPLNETLGKVEAQLRGIELERAGAQSALKEQINLVRLTGEQLRDETAALVNALRKPQTRGQWGEIQLKNCVKAAGMLEHCDFIEQMSVAGDDGLQRPDMVVHLAGDGTVVVDAKVSLIAFLEAHEAADDASRDAHLARHARHMRQHVDTLAKKAYWSHVPSAPDFVIMFVPSEAAMYAALETDPTLFAYASEQRVQILGPMALVPTLRAAAFNWKQAALADNAREVFELGQELYRRLGVFGGHMAKLGRSLGTAVSTYNDSVGSLETKVLSAARRLQELKVTDEPLKELTGLEDTVRPLSKAELVASEEGGSALFAIPSSGEELHRLDDFGINVRNEPERDRRTGS